MLNDPSSWNWEGSKDGAIGFFWDAPVSTAKGLWQMASDPGGTYDGLKYAFNNPGEAWDAISSEYSTLAQSDRGRGQILGEIAIAIVATKGAASLTKAAKGSRIASGLRGLSSTVKNSRYVKRISVIGAVGEYEPLAQRLGANYFHMPESTWQSLSTADRWAFNKQFLDLAINRGDDFILATPISRARPLSYYAREIAYLAKNGYSLSTDGAKMIKGG